MAKSVTLHCDYCNTVQEIGLVWSCVQCGAPLRPPPEDMRSTLQSRQESGLPSITNNAYVVLDYSKWQGAVFYDILTGCVVSGEVFKVIIKASQSTNQDAQYQANIAGLMKNKISFDLYHYLDLRYGVINAARFFAGQVIALAGSWRQLDNRTKISPYGSKFRVWLDVESNYGPGASVLSPLAMESAILEFIQEFKRLTGIDLGIYTRASFWNVAVIHNSWAHNFALWVAHYNQSIPAPTIPDDWLNYNKTWEVWQVDDKGLGKDGPYYGMQSHGIDISCVNCNPKDSITYAWYIEGEPPPQPPPEPEFVPYFVRVNTASLNQRTEPDSTGGKATIIDTIAYNKRVMVINERTDSNGEKWLLTQAWVAGWLTKPSE